MKVAGRLVLLNQVAQEHGLSKDELWEIIRKRSIRWWPDPEEEGQYLINPEELNSRRIT